MTARAIVQVTIHAKPSEIFRYLENTDLLYLWNPTLQQVSSKKGLKAGDTYRSTNLLLGITVKSVNKVTKYVRGEELEVTNDTGMLHYQANYRLEAAPKGIKVICNTTVSAKSQAFAFTKPVLTLLAKHELQSDLKALKIAVEQGLADTD